MEDTWYPVDYSPKVGVPILVIWKTRPGFPQKLDDAYQISDDFWFAEVSSWRYYQDSDEDWLDQLAAKSVFIPVDPDLEETEEIEIK